MSISRNISDAGAKGRLERTGKGKRAMVMFDVWWFILLFGIENVGFLTLTFRDGDTITFDEASKRFDHFNRHLMEQLCTHYIAVIARERGRVVIHVVINVGKDIRTGFNFAEVRRREYRSVCQHLRERWTLLRTRAEGLKFGRIELKPIRENAEAVARYITNHIPLHRSDEEKGKRLVRCSHGFKLTKKLPFLTETQRDIEQSAVKLAKCLGLTAENYKQALKARFGSRWSKEFYPLVWNIRGRSEDYFREACRILADKWIKAAPTPAQSANFL